MVSQREDTMNGCVESNVYDIDKGRILLTMYLIHSISIFLQQY